MSGIREKIDKELKSFQTELDKFIKLNSVLSSVENTHDSSIRTLSDSSKIFIDKAEVIAKALASMKATTGRIEILKNQIEGVDFPKRLESIETTTKEVVKSLEGANNEFKNEAEILLKKLNQVDFSKQFQIQNKYLENTESNSQMAIQTIENFKIKKTLEEFSNHIRTDSREKLDKLEKGLLNTTKNQLELNRENIRGDVNSIYQQIQKLDIAENFGSLNFKLGGLQSAIESVNKELARNEADLRNQFEKVFDYLKEQKAQLEKVISGQRSSSVLQIAFGVLSLAALIFLIIKSLG